MLSPIITWETCQICEPCTARTVCKVRAIVKIDPDEAPYIDLDRCNGCGNCIPACPYEAITLRKSSRQNQSR